MEEIEWAPIGCEEDGVNDLCAIIPLYSLDTFVVGESK